MDFPIRLKSTEDAAGTTCRHRARRDPIPAFLARSHRTSLAAFASGARCPKVPFTKSDKLAEFGENEIKEFLTDLAVVQNVAVATQDQALAALLFFYQKVIRRELEFIDASRSKKPVTLPVVLSRRETVRLAICISIAPSFTRSPQQSDPPPSPFRQYVRRLFPIAAQARLHRKERRTAYASA